MNIYEEASRCLLCQDAPCTKACQTGAIGVTKRIEKKIK
jgi:Fe-S-cluster-containing hydrogenase component 2